MKYKFRAWSQNLKEMRYDWTNFSILAMAESRHIKPVVPMMFIEQKDKNKKEIYEGDILRCEDGEFSWVGKVQWNNNEAQFEVYCYGVDGTNETLRFGNDVENEMIEVIGNIYENPELLKTSGVDEK